MRWLLYLSAFVLIGPVFSALRCPTVDAQEALRHVARPQLVPRVYALEHASPYAIHDLLRSLFQGEIRVAVDERTARVVVYGADSAHEQIRTLIAEIDTPAQAGGRLETRIFRLRNRLAGALSNLAQQQLRSREASFVTDSARNAIVARASGAELDELQRLLDAMDRPSRTVTMALTLLEPSGDTRGALSEGVRRELARLGLEGLGVGGRAAIRAVDGGDFTITDQVSAEVLSVSGTVHLNPESDTAVLDLTVKIGGSQSQVTFQSTLHAPLGDEVLVGMAPASSGEEKHELALVVRLTAGELVRAR